MMFTKLEFLIALARERHFGRAAEACGVAQPTLSAGMKQLEESLGVLLVERGSRFRGLTPEGEIVLAYARRIVAEARSLRQELAAMQRGLHGLLRIGVIPTVLPIVHRLTVPYRQHHPGVDFTVHSCTSSEILAGLEDLEIDAGLTYLDNEPIGRVTSIPIYAESYRFVVGASDRFAGHRDITWAEIVSEPLCLLTSDMQNRRIIEQALRAKGQPRTPILESNSLIVLLSHIRSAGWASILPAVMAEEAGLAPGLLALPIVDPVISHTIGLVVALREPHTPMIGALITEARRLSRSFAARVA